jgi:hypothetical protein
VLLYSAANRQSNEGYRKPVGDPGIRKAALLLAKRRFGSIALKKSQFNRAKPPKRPLAGQL